MKRTVFKTSFSTEKDSTLPFNYFARSHSFLITALF